MIIAVNTRLLLPNKLEGIGWFTFETLKRITQAHPADTFYFFFDRKFDARFIFSENVIPIVLSPPARHPFLFYIWFEWSVTQMLNKIKADLFFSPDGFMSLRTKVPTVITIHDLAYFHFPKSVPAIQQWYYERYMPLFANKAARITTVSEFSKHDIVKRLHIAQDKIDVVHNGVNTNYVAIQDHEKISVREKFTHGQKYFLFVGALQPRKNVGNLFRAFDKFCEKIGKPVFLVIVGRKAWKYDEIFQIYEGMKYKDYVVFSGHLNEVDLKNLYGAAEALVFASLFEGFGIPILEAFACGCPLITSNVTSMPEIGGEGAIYVDPESADSISDAMLKIWNEPELVSKLVQAGQLCLQEFSWDKTAEKVWESLVFNKDMG